MTFDSNFKHSEATIDGDASKRAEGIPAGGKKTKRLKSNPGANGGHRGNRKIFPTMPIYDSMAQCVSATGVPLAALKMAKAGGCEAFRSTRVDFAKFLRWWFSQVEDDANVDWSRELRKAQAMRERLKLAEDEGRMIDFGAVSEYLRLLVGMLFGDLDRIFCAELPPALKGLDEVRVRLRCEQEIERMKAGLGVVVEEWLKTNKSPTP